jgi:hypothetical protein
MKFRVFWDVAPCSHVEVNRNFTGAYCLRRHRPDGGSTHLWNVGPLQRDYTDLLPRRPQTSNKLRSTLVRDREMVGLNGSWENRLWVVRISGINWLRIMSISRLLRWLNIFSCIAGKQSSPATRHGGAWGERRYISYSFLTTALDGGECSASRPGHALSRGKDPRYPLYRRLGGPQTRSGHRG